MNFSEKWGTDVDEAVELALKDLHLTIDEVDVEVLEEPSRGFFGIGSKLAKVRVTKKEVVKEEVVEKPVKEHVERKAPEIISEKPADLVEITDHVAITFLKGVTEQMGLSLDISAKGNKDSLYIDIKGKDAGTIIGKRGQTLDSIQYLTSLVANKGREDYLRVIIDAENYRSKRERTLKHLAEKIADKVSRTGRSVRLEPMNPYERKVIHATLQNKPGIVTRSEGEEPYRRVIIDVKR